MGESFWRLVLGTALVGAVAMAQEIVIEPTNGRAPTGHSASAPAPEASRPVPHGTQSSNRPRTTSAKMAKKTSGASKGASAEEDKHARGTPAPSVPAMAKNEGAEAAEVESKPPTRPAWAMDDTRDASSLQNEISEAMAREPKLAHSAIQVKVDDAGVTLEGRAEGSEARLQAERLAKSYAWNRKLVDRIEVASSIAAKK